MKHYTKLRRDVAISERMADLLDKDGFAYGVFLNMKAVCDDYGRLPAEPRKLKALACPMSNKPLSRFAKALKTMQEEGTAVIRAYEADGHAYFEILEYNNVEKTHWYNVGLPEYPQPDDWTPPQSLIEHILTASDPRIKPERYGLRDEQVPGWQPKPKKPKKSVSDGQSSYPNDTPIIGGASEHYVSDSDSDSAFVSDSDSDSESEGVSPEGGSGETTPPADPDAKALLEEVHLSGCGSALGQAAWRYWRDGRAPGGRDNWRAQLLGAFKIEQNQPDALTEAEVLAAFQKHPPQVSEFPDKWLSRVRRMERGSPKTPRRLSDDQRVLPDQDSFGEARP